MKYFLLTFSIYILTTTTSISETRIESLIGVVTKVDVLNSSYVKKIPQDIPLLTGKCMKPKWASGTSIVLNKKGRQHLLTYGFKNVYYKI